MQDPTNLHTFNRYSYVMNNPLKYTDPSGQILKYVAEGREIELPEGTENTPGGGGGGGDQHSPSGWDPTMGGHSMFGQVANVYGTLAAMAAYATGYSSGPGMGFGSAFAGRGYVSQTGFYISSHTTYYANAGLNGYVGSEKVPIGESTTYKTYEYSVFNNGTLSGNYWTGGSGVDMNNATACNGCGVLNSPTRSNIGNNAFAAGISRMWYTSQVSSLKGLDQIEGVLSRTFIKSFWRQNMMPYPAGQLFEKAWPNNPVWWSTTKPGQIASFWSTSKAFNIMGKVGIGLGVLSIGYDTYRVGTGQMSGLKYGLGLGATGLMYFGGPIGFAIGGSYQLIDATIGWDNAMNNYQTIDNAHRRVIGIGFGIGPKWLIEKPNPKFSAN